MKFTYNPTKKTSLGGSCIEKYIYIYIYTMHSYIQTKKNLAWPQKKQNKTKKFSLAPKKKYKTKKISLQTKKISFKRKNFSKKNLLQNKKKFIHSKKKIKKNFHQNIKIHRFNQNIKKSMKNEVHPDPPKPPF